MAITRLPSRIEFQELSRLRIYEARTLLAASEACASGAYYLAGYAVECAFKARIAGMSFEAFYANSNANNYITHDLKKLLFYAGLEIPPDTELQENWTIVKAWTEESRYFVHSVPEAQNVVNAVNDSQKGVLIWSVTQW